MCYSKETSIISFFICSILSIILCFYNLVFGLFFIYIGLIQLLEYILWINQNNLKYNYIFTKITMIINLYQPIFLALLLFTINNQKIKTMSAILSIIYFVITTLYVIFIWNKVDFTLQDNNSKFPSLYWKWVEQKPYIKIIAILYLATFISIFFEHFIFPLNILLIVVFLFGFIFTKIFKKGASQLSRFWCNYGAFTPLLFIVMFYIEENTSGSIRLRK